MLDLEKLFGAFFTPKEQELQVYVYPLAPSTINLAHFKDTARAGEYLDVIDLTKFLINRILEESENQKPGIVGWIDNHGPILYNSIYEWNKAIIELAPAAMLELRNLPNTLEKQKLEWYIGALVVLIHWQTGREL